MLAMGPLVPRPNSPSCAAWAVLALLLAAPALGRAADNVRIDPQADQVLQRMSTHLAAAREFSFSTRTLIDRVHENGLRLQFARQARVAVRRPNAIAATARGDLEDFGWWYQGGRLALLDRTNKTYAQIDVPDTIDAMLDFVATEHGLVMPLCDLLVSDPHRSLLERVHTGIYAGRHDVDGVPCHHLAFRQETVDWQIWIQDGPEPLPRKVVITYKDMPGSPQFIAFLEQWELGKPVPDAAFTFTPPPEARRVELPSLRQSAEATPATATQPARRGS